MKNKFYRLVLNNLKNIPGSNVSGKIIVIECDDWGGIRMPSKAVYERLLKLEIPVNKSRYNSYDTLADNVDLEMLFKVLKSVNGRNGKPAVMTPVSNVANPDFEKIRESDFKTYYYEPFTATLKRYGRHPDTFQLWQQGIKEGIFTPESHGREHIAVQFWMQKLREGDRKVKLAFDNEFISIETDGMPKAVKQFRPEFFYNTIDQKSFLEHSIKDGVELFHNIFGYRPTVFVPSNGIFHPDLEPSLARTGVPYLYTGQCDPVYNLDGSVNHNLHKFDQKSKSGLRYYMRNCAFEPTDELYRGIGITLKQIESAFRWKKPAIISTHRVNFVGGIDQNNREKGLSELSLLLKVIVKKWPEVEFLSSAELFRDRLKN